MGRGRLRIRMPRVPLGVQVGLVALVFAGAVGSLWWAASEGFDRELRRAEAAGRLVRAEAALAQAGGGPLALIPDWPETLAASEWDAIDRWLAAEADEALRPYPGVEGGYYLPQEDRYLGAAAGPSEAPAAASLEEPVSTGGKTVPPRRPRAHSPEPPARDFTLIDDRVQEALRRERAVSLLVEAPGGTAALRAAPVSVNGRRIAAAWTLARIDDAGAADRALRGYRKAAGVALGGFALALVLAAGLARTVRRQARDQARMQAELRRGERLAALGKLLAGVAHEARNPLAGLRSTVQLWQRGLGPDPESMADAVAEVDRLDALVARLLQFSRPDANDRHPGDFNAVVVEAARLARLASAGHGVRVELDLDPSLPPAVFSEPALLQVLRNLTSNAIQAMPGGGTLRFATSLDPGRRMVIARITDGGHGLAPQVREHLFEPFFTTKPEGTGLGLAIAREIALGHGGDLRAEPPNGRPGAEFILTVPLAE